MIAHLVGYTHTEKILDYIYQCTHCGKQCSDLRRFEKERDKRFKDLEPTPKQPSVWYQHRYKHSKRNFEWRLNCRGRVWSGCEYCRAIFLQAAGKRGDHNKERCSKWLQLRKKRNRDWMQDDQVPSLKRRAAAAVATISSSPSRRSATATNNAEHSDSELNGAAVEELDDPLLDDVFLEELLSVLKDDTFV